jgi:hypothetical protein
MLSFLFSLPMSHFHREPKILSWVERMKLAFANLESWATIAFSSSHFRVEPKILSWFEHIRFAFANLEIWATKAS